MFGPDIDNNDFDMVFTLCNSFKLATICLSSDKYITHANSIAESLFLHTKNQLIGESFTEVCQKFGIDPFVPAIDSETNEYCTKLITHWVSEQKFIEVDWNIMRCLTQGKPTGFFLIGKIIISSLSAHPLQNMQDIIRSLPVAIFSKDDKGYYSVVNEYQAHIAGFSSIKEMVGKTDEYASWTQEAAIVRRGDNRAISTHKPLILHEYLTLFDGTKRNLLVTKSAFKNEIGQVLGVIGTSVIAPEHSLPYIETLESHFITPEDSLTYLSKKEIECIHWLIKGKSAEEIAIILGISKRTVETHFNNIKKKLNCYKLFQVGYLVGKYGYLLL